MLVPQIGAVGWDVMGWNGLEWMVWGGVVRFVAYIFNGKLVRGQGEGPKIFQDGHATPVPYPESNKTFLCYWLG